MGPSDEPRADLPEPPPEAPPQLAPPAVGRFGSLRARVAALKPGRRAWGGATRGVLAVAFALLVASAWSEFAVPAPNWYGLAALAALVAASLAAGLSLALLLRVVAALPFRYLWAVLAALGLLAPAYLFTPLGFKGFWALSLLTLALASITGAGLAALARGGSARLAPGARFVARTGLALGLLASVGGILWLAWPGKGAEPVAGRQAPASPPAGAALEDPGRAGPYRVRTLTYGSGADRHRPEFGSQVVLRTRPFDGSPFVKGWSGAAGAARTGYWGFDARALPLQGSVFYPDAIGPFPLVLCVHGNHTAEASSDPGYAYLGELLASRGFIFVSVDENFLNGSLSDLLGFPELQLEEENDLRAVLLLEHLRQWREWNASADAAQPFRGRVDLGRVALIGHSRGGEAVAVAAAFNPLSGYPDDATIRFDYRFGLRAVVAIAPVDGQYKPAGAGTRPRNVDYLTLHGSMDGDMRSFHGSRVFERVGFDDGRSHFKAGVWVHGANHGQFNTRWGRNDMGGFAGTMLRLAPIMPEQDQRRIAQVFITAFLEASLRDQPGYRALFRDRRVAGAWLPDVVCLQQYADTDTRVVAGFDEDIDVATTTLAGGSIAAAGLADWKERELELRWGKLETRGVFLGWSAAPAAPATAAPATAPGAQPREAAWYAVRLPDGGLSLTADAALSFELADSGAKATKRDAAGRALDSASPSPAPAASPQKAGPDAAPPRDPIDFTIELSDRAGTVARVALGRVGGLQRRIETQATKLPALDDVAASELVLAHFDLPLRLFLEASPALDPARLSQVRLVFDRTPEAVLVLDDLGFRVPPAAADASRGAARP